MAKQLPKTYAEKYIEGFHKKWPGLTKAEEYSQEDINLTLNKNASIIEYYECISYIAMLSSGINTDTIKELRASSNQDNIVLWGDVAIDSIWKKCKQVYKIDDMLFKELISQELPGEIPAEVLFHIPYPIQFIETPIFTLDVEKNENLTPLIKGFFVSIVQEGSTLCLFIKIIDTHESSLSFPLYIKQNKKISDYIADIAKGLNDTQYAILSSLTMLVRILPLLKRGR